MSKDGYALSSITKLKEHVLSVYSVKNQTIQLPKVNLTHSPHLNLINKEGPLPATIQFNTPGEITTNNETKIHF